MRKMSEKHEGKIYDFVTYLLRDHIYCTQTELIDSLINDYGLINKYHHDTFHEIEDCFEDAFEDVKEWWLITPILGKLLEKQNEIIITLEKCMWWGRLSSDSLYNDEVFRKIYRVRTVKLYKKEK